MQPTNYKIYYLLSVVFPIKPFILLTIIKHKNVFLYLATRIPKGGEEELRVFLLGPSIRQCVLVRSVEVSVSPPCQPRSG